MQILFVVKKLRYQIFKHLLKYEKYAEISRIFFIFSLPFQLGVYLFMPFSYIHGLKVDYLALSFFISDIAFIALFATHIRLLQSVINQSLHNKNAFIWVFAIIVFASINIYVSTSFHIAIFKWFKFIQIGIIFFIFSKKQIKITSLTKVLIFSGLIQLAISSNQVFSGSTANGLLYMLGERSFNLATPGIAKIAVEGREILRGYGTFPHPNALAGFYLLIYIFYLYKPDNKDGGIILENILKPILLLLIFFTFSKFTFAILFLFIILNTLKDKSIDCFICRLSKVLLPAFFTIFIFTSTGDPESLSKRFYLNTSALDIIWNNLFFGAGAGNYIFEQAKYTHNFPYVFLQPVHNIFLLLSSEMGLIFIFFLIIALFRSLKRIKKFVSNNPLFNSLMLAVFLTGMFDHYWLTIQQNLLILPCILGIAVNIISKARRPESAVVK
jgi:hypothetical protein